MPCRTQHDASWYITPWWLSLNNRSKGNDNCSNIHFRCVSTDVLLCKIRFEGRRSLLGVISKKHLKKARVNEPRNLILYLIPWQSSLFLKMPMEEQDRPLATLLIQSTCVRDSSVKPTASFCWAKVWCGITRNLVVSHGYWRANIPGLKGELGSLDVFHLQAISFSVKHIDLQKIRIHLTLDIVNYLDFGRWQHGSLTRSHNFRRCCCFISFFVFCARLLWVAKKNP